MGKFSIYLFLNLILFNYSTGIENKYSKEANLNLKDAKDILRMGKLNVIWEKARMRLGEEKLKKFYSEMKVLDKEELTLKKLKSSGGDKEGFKEAELRKKLKEILHKYGLEQNKDEHVNGDIDAKIEKANFKDKKLHKLWLKAEKSGLTDEELKTLREEFQHHELKIEEYNEMISSLSSNSGNDVGEISNDIHELEKLDSLEGSAENYQNNVEAIRAKHHDLKNNYNQLHRKAVSGPEAREFYDPKVTGLWRLALRSDFDDVELESLYTELKHYETRLKKLNHLTNQINKITLDKSGAEDFSAEDIDFLEKSRISDQNEDSEGMKVLEEKLVKQKRKAEKLHEHLEMRIVGRHSEF